MMHIFVLLSMWYICDICVIEAVIYPMLFAVLWLQPTVESGQLEKKEEKNIHWFSFCPAWALLFIYTLFFLGRQTLLLLLLHYLGNRLRYEQGQGRPIFSEPGPNVQLILCYNYLARARMSPSPDSSEAVVGSWVDSWLDSWGSLSGHVSNIIRTLSRTLAQCLPVPGSEKQYLFQYTEPDICRPLGLFILKV